MLNKPPYIINFSIEFKIQDSNAEQATLHHQVLYRVQDHALDLNLPNTTGEALFMFTDNARGPAIVNIPRMITTDELSSIIPLEWITDYEKAFPKEQIDVHTTTPPTITHNSDGTVTTVFQRPRITKQTSLRRPSFRRINMISPVQVQTTHNQHDPPVHFYENGKPVYVSHINGHFIWDVDPSMCDSDCDCVNQWSDSDEEEYERRQRNRKRRRSHFQHLAPSKDLSLLTTLTQPQ
ncbi:polyprotein [Arachis hypogaea]|nr:polyprotein [Arachis hypogaea]